MKYKKFIKEFLIWLFVGIAIALVSHYFIEILYYNYNYSHVLNTVLNVRFELFVLGSFVLFIIYTFLSSLFGSRTIGAILLFLISWIFGIATQYKSHFRAEPLYPNELYMIKEIPFLLEMIGKRKSLMLIFVILLTVVGIFLLNNKILRSLKSRESQKSKMVIRLVGLSVSLALLFYVGKFNYPNNKVSDIYSNYASWVRYNQTRI